MKKKSVSVYFLVATQLIVLKKEAHAIKQIAPKRKGKYLKSFINYLQSVYLKGILWMKKKKNSDQIRMKIKTREKEANKVQR